MWTHFLAPYLPCSLFTGSETGGIRFYRRDLLYFAIAVALKMWPKNRQRTSSRLLLYLIGRHDSLRILSRRNGCRCENLTLRKIWPLCVKVGSRHGLCRCRKQRWRVGHRWHRWLRCRRDIWNATTSPASSDMSDVRSLSASSSCFCGCGAMRAFALYQLLRHCRVHGSGCRICRTRSQNYVIVAYNFVRVYTHWVDSDCFATSIRHCTCINTVRDISVITEYTRLLSIFIF